jgi:DUF438 domain-containing protein
VCSPRLNPIELLEEKMSEYFNNRSKRTEMLKNVLKGLHEGKSLNEVKAMFAVLVQMAESGEVTEVERRLLDD